MTHFTVGIIVPEPMLPHLPAYLHSQMEPFDENTDVEPYVCYSIEQAKADIQRDITRLEQIIAKSDPEFDPARCENLLERLRGTTPEERYRERLKFHERFNDHGEPLSTYNPDSKWDWWVVGGRWDGWIHDRQAAGERIDDNMATTGEALARGKIPHALVTPDGTWHEHGQMGWWAILLTENDHWETDAREILARYPGHHVVILDAHI